MGSGCAILGVESLPDLPNVKIIRDFRFARLAKGKNRCGRHFARLVKGKNRCGRHFASLAKPYNRCGRHFTRLAKGKNRCGRHFASLAKHRLRLLRAADFPAAPAPLVFKAFFCSGRKRLTGAGAALRHRWFAFPGDGLLAEGMGRGIFS